MIIMIIYVANNRATHDSGIHIVSTILYNDS